MFKRMRLGKFHIPENLAMALTIEASELLEIFLWSMDGGQDDYKITI